VQAKQTQPPPRYNEGTLVDAMQNAWRFVKDETLRERLKEAKGIGTPATRAEIIKGLKRQSLLAADGKLVVPTPAGLKLFGLLRGAAPALVDPATTAIWEMRLDDIVLGKVGYRAVIDEIAGEADRLITVLRQHNGDTVDLSQPAPQRTTRGRSKVGRKNRAGGHAAATSDEAKPRSRRPRRAKNASRQRMAERGQDGHLELGRELGLRCSNLNDGFGHRMPVFSVGDSALALFPAGHPGVAGETKPGVHHIALGVDHLESGLEAASKARHARRHIRVPRHKCHIGKIASQRHTAFSATCTGPAAAMPP
jgi:DNA topoisomerase